MANPKTIHETGEVGRIYVKSSTHDNKEEVCTLSHKIYFKNHIPWDTKTYSS